MHSTHCKTHQPPPSLPPPPSAAERRVNLVPCCPPPPLPTTKINPRQPQQIPQVRAIRTIYRSTYQTRRHELQPRTANTAFPLPPPPNLQRALMNQQQRGNRSSNSSSGGGGRRTRVGSGPCGVPQEDRANGYRRYANNRTELNEPIDRDLMKTEFDFEFNLTLFDKDASK